MFYLCQSSVCFYFTLIRRFQHKLSPFFFFLSFFFTLSLSDKKQQQLLSLSASTTRLFTKKRKKKFSLDWTETEKNMYERTLWGSSHCPAWSVTEFISCSNISAFQTSFMRGAEAQGWSFEERMKQTCLRLETLTGMFHHFLSVQGMKPKCCHLHIFLVESGEKREKHFGEHFKLGMCLFPGLACLALNEIQSLFRQQQIRHN